MLKRVRIVLTAGGLAAAGAVAGMVVAATPASAGSAAGQVPAASGVVLVNQCTGKGQVRPATVALPDCMTSSELIGHAGWTSWGQAAFGHGVLEVNNCTPSSSCGPSQYNKYPILIGLWRPEHWAGRSDTDYFSRLTWIFTGSRPRHAGAAHTLVLPSAAQ